jgi:hypothetical protein
MSSDRVEVIENTHEVDHSRNATCIRYQIRLTDANAPNAPQGAPLVTIDRGLVCTHPTFQGRAVRASFSECGFEEELDPSLWANFEDFLRGVRIESAPGVPVA